MSIESEIIGYLQSKTSITDIVGNKIFVGVMTSHTYPAIVINLPSTSYTQNNQGSNGIAYPRVQFDCYSYSGIEAAAIVEAIRHVLQGYKGDLVNDEVISSKLENESTVPEKPIDGSEIYVHRKMAEYELQIRVSIPSF